MLRDWTGRKELDCVEELVHAEREHNDKYDDGHGLVSGNEELDCAEDLIYVEQEDNDGHDIGHETREKGN